MKISHESGFTIYELLVTMLIIGIVLTVGVPNLREFTANSRITASANDLHSSFMVARSEAARSKAIVTICASADSSTCGAADTFDDGWIIFADLNGDLQRAGDGEDVLRRHPAIDARIDINVNANANFFSFAPTGLGRGDVGGKVAFQTAVLCDDRGNTTAAGGYSAARFLVVSPIGRSTVIRDMTTIADAGGCP